MAETLIAFEYEEAHAISMGLLRTLAAMEADVQLGLLGTALTLGFLMSPKEMSENENVAFVQHILENAGLYFAEGTPNQ